MFTFYCGSQALSSVYELLTTDDEFVDIYVIGNVLSANSHQSRLFIQFLIKLWLVKLVPYHYLSIGYASCKLFRKFTYKLLNDVLFGIKFFFFWLYPENSISPTIIVNCYPQQIFSHYTRPGISKRYETKHKDPRNYDCHTWLVRVYMQYYITTHTNQ